MANSIRQLQFASLVDNKEIICDVNLAYTKEGVCKK
jgi:hypothetical protein